MLKSQRKKDEEDAKRKEITLEEFLEVEVSEVRASASVRVEELSGRATRTRAPRWSEEGGCLSEGRRE